MRREPILAALSLLATVACARADVTVQGWWHYGEITDYYVDSSPNARRFGAAFSTGTSGNANAGITPLGVGGPLGTTGFVSTNSLYWTPAKLPAAGMWSPGATATTPTYNPPATNYGIELWALPDYPGVRGGVTTWLFGSGESGGVRIQLTNNVEEGTMTIAARHIGGEQRTIGTHAVIGTNRWTHLAVVVADDGTRFFVDGVQQGPTDTGPTTTPAGDIFGGSSPGTTPTFAGFLDELRIFTFAPGQFSTNDLLLRPPGPNLLRQPAPMTVWAGGVAPLNVLSVYDLATTYQWRKAGVNLPGATTATYNYGPVTAADNGVNFDVIVTLNGLSVTSTAAPLTVVAPNPTDVAAYRDAVNAEASLVGYYPIDGDTGTVIANTKNAAANGAIEQTVFFDSRTNRAFGSRALLFQGGGVVQIPATPAYEFPSGNGTIEAVIHLEPGAITEPVLFTVGHDFGGGTYYSLLATRDGSSLVYSNDAVGRLSWPVPQNLIGRRAHVAFVFQNGTDITAYLDGLPLGTKTQTSFGFGAGGNAWIGGTGANTPDNRWLGSIDELSIYSTALPMNTVQTHFSKYFYGTNTAAPAIVSQPTGPRDVLAGSAPVLSVATTGTLPLAYQWTANGQPIAGATSPRLVVPNTAAGSSVSYVLQVSNPFGTVSTTPIVLNFLPVTGAYAQKVLADRPSSYWRLNEASGATVAVDRAGFNDATYAGALTQGVPGAFRQETDTAVRFTDGNAVAPWSASLNPQGPFSIEFWAKPDQTGATGRSVVGSQNRNIGRSGYVVYQGLNSPAPGGRWEAHLGDASTVQVWLYSLTVPQAGQWYHVVVVYDGTNTGRIYVNGADDTDEANSDETGGVLPNSAAPFEIASRSGGQIKYPGTVDDVAFYNYALTPAQILEHFKIQYAPAQITEQPVGVTNYEGSTINLQVVASGLPNTYQWFKDGGAVPEMENPDTTPHYPGGTTNTSLTIAQAVPGDSGTYRVNIANPNGGVNSVNVQVLVLPDTNAPAVASAQALPTPNSDGTKPYLVRVIFNKRVDSATAPMIANYSINGGITVTNVYFFEDVRAGALNGDWKSVVLATTGLTPGQTYTVTVTGVKDRALVPNTIVPAATPFEAPVLTQGVANWDYYFLGVENAGDITSVLGSPLYPGGSLTNSSLANFDSREYTGGSLENTFFGALGENYGSTISGWLTPTQSGNYTFFLHSDDPSELYLSTDANPGNVVKIAEETGCCNDFTEPGVPYTSAPIPLTAGNRYYIRAVHLEKTGGDYVRVGWRHQSVTGLPTTAIPGQFLSSFAPVPAPRFTGTTLVGNKLTLTWTGSGVLYESTNFTNWSIVPGNPVSGVQVDVVGPQKFYRLVR